jgi:hypothetical protein
MKKAFFCLVSIFYLLTNAVAQTDTSSTTVVNPTLSGTIMDENNQQPLPYASIINLNNGKGTISNEHGNFTIDITNLKTSDTIRFQCIGYKTKELTIERIASNAPILLSENIYALDEVLVLGTTPKVKDIIEGILENKEVNYRLITHKKQVFIRKKSSSDFLDFKLNYKKSTLSDLSPEIVKSIEEHTPKHSTSYSDFLGYVYSMEDEEKKSQLKIVPIKTVELKSKDITELESSYSVFDSLFSNTKEKEYWKVKTGILGTKINFSNKDDKDSTNYQSLKSYSNRVNNHLSYSTFEDDDLWEFLHKTKRYNYTIIGGTSINNESVYIIDFTPKRKGIYEGRLYVAIKSSALIRADYKYAPDKFGMNVHLLGIGYTQTIFNGSIYFEKNNGNYNLKYFSHQSEYKISVNRKIALQHKKKRFLFDKKLNELKVGLDFSQIHKESLELLVIDKQEITADEFEGFKQQDKMEITYINQFDESLWKGYTTITPTKQMKEYKKLEE